MGVKSAMEMIRIPISDRAINSVIWHKKINQLFVAGNDSNVRIYYNDKSKNGDLLLHKPTMPHYGIGVQGRQNTESFAHHVYKSQEKNIMSSVDPRDRLLLFNEKAEQQPMFTSIYSINQPKTIFQQRNEEELAANDIVSTLYKEKPGARQYNPMKSKEPPKKKKKNPHKKKKKKKKKKK